MKPLATKTIHHEPKFPKLNLKFSNLAFKFQKHDPKFINLNLKSKKFASASARSGFTLIEVMLVLGIAGLLLIGVLGTAFSGINTQRYNDSVQSLAEYLRATYSKVISPSTDGNGNSGSMAILGKILVFGLESDKVYSATIVGHPDIPESSANSNFLVEFANASPKLLCGDNTVTPAIPTSVSDHLITWESTLKKPRPDGAASYDIASSTNNFSGTLIIARSPASTVVHTRYLAEPIKLKTQCDITSGSIQASDRFQTILAHNTTSIPIGGTPLDEKIEPKVVGMCVFSDLVGAYREIRIAADARNSSGISVVSADTVDKYSESMTTNSSGGLVSGGSIIEMGNRCK